MKLDCQGIPQSYKETVRLLASVFRSYWSGCLYTVCFCGTLGYIINPAIIQLWNGCDVITELKTWGCVVRIGNNKASKPEQQQQKHLPRRNQVLGRRGSSPTAFFESVSALDNSLEAALALNPQCSLGQAASSKLDCHKKLRRSMSILSGHLVLETRVR